MSEIKAELTGSSIYVKTRRTLFVVEINAEDSIVNVYYKEIKYYMEGENEVIISEESKSYSADYAEWETDAVGVAIKAAVELQLAKEVPGSVE